MMILSLQNKPMTMYKIYSLSIKISKFLIPNSSIKSNNNFHHLPHIHHKDQVLMIQRNYRSQKMIENLLNLLTFNNN